MGYSKKVFKWVFVILIVIFLVSIQASAITAKAKISPVQGSAPLNVMFTDISEGSPIEWHWDFGDGFTGDGPKTMHTYMSPGTYSVTLLVLDAQGMADTATFSQVISVSANPFMPSMPMVAPSFSADFTGGPQNGPAPLTVSFADLSKGNPTSWLWNFGDGSTSNEQNPVHIYSAPGSYTVILQISKENSTGNKERKNYITVTAGSAGGTQMEVSSTSTEQSIPVEGQMLAEPSLTPHTGEEYYFQMYPVSAEKECDSGLSFKIDTVNISQGENFEVLVTGEPLEKVYVWIAAEDVKINNPKGFFPIIKNEDMVYDDFDGTYPVGSYIPNITTGLTIRDLIPDNESEYSTRYYGVLGLDKYGEQTIIFSSKDSSSGVYSLNAVIKKEGENCIEELPFQIIPK